MALDRGEHAREDIRRAFERLDPAAIEPGVDARLRYGREVSPFGSLQLRVGAHVALQAGGRLSRLEVLPEPGDDASGAPQLTLQGVLGRRVDRQSDRLRLGRGLEALRVS